MRGDARKHHAASVGYPYVDEDEDDPADLAETADPDQGASLLDVYFREMAGHALLKPEEEVKIAKAIQAAEVHTWEVALGLPEMVAAVLAVAGPELAAPAPTFPTLTSAADQVMQYPTVLSRKQRYQTAVRSAAKKLRALDLDRGAVDKVVAYLRGVTAPVSRDDTPDASGTASCGVASADAVTGSAWGAYLRSVRAAYAESSRLRDKFISANLRLVVSMAKRFNHSTNNSNGHSNGAMPLADLIQEGNLGLMHAVSRFDYKRGLRFSTYACWWIRHAIGRAVADKARTVRVPVRMLEVCGQLDRARQRLESDLDHTPTSEEIIAAAEVSPATAAVLEGCVIGQPVYVDKAIGESGDCTMLDMMVDPTSEEHNVEDDVAGRADVARMQRLMKRLSKLEVAVLESRFGLGDGKERTLRSIGKEYGLSRERIRQIQNDALERLKELMEDKDE